jgi:hypothetical protein
VLIADWPKCSPPTKRECYKSICGGTWFIINLTNFARFTTTFPFPSPRHHHPQPYQNHNYSIQTKWQDVQPVATATARTSHILNLVSTVVCQIQRSGYSTWAGSVRMLTSSLFASTWCPTSKLHQGCSRYVVWQKYPTNPKNLRTYN